MRYHHTKNKGDLGTIKVMADMAEKGWSVFVPLSEHEAFDFVAYRGGRFLHVRLRFAPTTNNQKKRVCHAVDYLEIPLTVRGVSAGETKGLVGWGWVRQSSHPLSV